MSTAVAAARSSAPANAPRREWILLLGYLFACLLAGSLWLGYLTRQTGAAYPPALAGPLWTIAVGILTNASCAILGCYLVLRRMSLLGDAISHAVLPGIVLGYYYSGSVVGWPIFLGAVIIGVVTAALTQAISSLGRVSEDTSMGVVFTSLFALGVILINALDMRNTHIDADCVLYGSIDLVSTDLTSFAGWLVPQTLFTVAPALVATVMFVGLLWKELKFVAFDPALAAAMGFRVAIVHYLLMGMVAGVSIAAFEAVGSILVVAMLIVPAATAALMDDRLRWMIAWSVAIGATSAIFGCLAAVALDANAAGMMAVVVGLQFATAVFLSPKQGLLTRWFRNRSLAVRIAAEDIIARLYREEEVAARKAGGGNQSTREGDVRVNGASSRLPPVTLASRWIAWIARLRLLRTGWIDRTAAGPIALTARGRAAARNLVRAHRLWETYLDTHFDLPRDHLHDAAERMEHFLDPQLQDELAAELADRAVDPHGKAIPPAEKR